MRRQKQRCRHNGITHQSEIMLIVILFYYSGYLYMKHFYIEIR